MVSNPEAHGPSNCYMFEVPNPGCEGQNPSYEGPMSLWETWFPRYVFQKASASILSLWPSYWRDLRLRLSEEDYRLIDQEGTWTDALDAQVGDVLEVVEDFDSGDQEAVRLTRGLRGILHFRDRDGDAMVRFPRRCSRLDAESVDRFVFEEDVRCSMRKRVAQQQPAAKKGAERLLRALESESGFSRNH
ncbi:unnamed protein product [Durusdinium trenchii]|uniref:Uncharacterized protein n=1 Tax=Durusdinium trenchii TaxID=1381693 RepID=A0ABP0SNE3_9DINO